MGDLISREAALKIIEKYCPDDDGSCSKADADMREMLDEIEDIPAVDAEPVRHERWAHLGGDEWCCTGCGEVIHTEGSWERPTKKFCSECGAKMNGGPKNEN